MMLSGILGQRETPRGQWRGSFLGLFLAAATCAMGCGEDTTDDSNGSTDGDGDGDGDTEELTPGEWNWKAYDGAFCRDGTTATMAIRPNPGSKNLMIFLEGGGACFDFLTCLANPATATKEFLPGFDDGLLNMDDARNPVKDWNVAYIPYCTGDSHAGTNPAGEVQGVSGTQMFVGYTNMSVFLKALVPMFPDTERVVLTGISAGGFGASANTVQVMNAFPPDVKGSLLDDSGPAMSSQYVAPCLQDRWRALWDLDNSMLKDCGESCPKKDDFLLDFSKHLAKTYGDRKSGIIETTEDGVIRLFFGVGRNNCTGSFIDPSGGIPGPTFTEGLLDFRAQMAEYPNFYTYYPSGDVAQQHTWLSNASMFTYTIDGVSMLEWVTAIINDQPTRNVGP